MSFPKTPKQIIIQKADWHQDKTISPYIREISPDFPSLLEQTEVSTDKREKKALTSEMN